MTIGEFLKGPSSSNLAREIREKFKNYLLSGTGKVPWKEEEVLRGAERMKDEKQQTLGSSIKIVCKVK